MSLLEWAQQAWPAAIPLLVFAIPGLVIAKAEEQIERNENQSPPTTRDVRNGGGHGNRPR